jgi:hypothetical protein
VATTYEPHGTKFTNLSCGVALIAAPVFVPQGKICLMQRGPGFHAEKVINCLIGGGVAAIIFARWANDGHLQDHGASADDAKTAAG